MLRGGVRWYPLGNFLYQNNHKLDWPEILTVWTKFPPATFQTIPTKFTPPPRASSPSPICGSLSKKSAFLRFFGIFTAYFGGKSPKFWYLFDFYRVFLNNFGSQPCGVVFWVKWGLNLEKWPFLGIFQPCLKCYRRLKFLIREVNFHNLLTLYLYFMLKKEFVAKNSEKMKNSSFFVKSPFWGTPTKMGVTILVLLGVILS